MKRYDPTGRDSHSSMAEPLAPQNVVEHLRGWKATQPVFGPKIFQPSGLQGFIENLSPFFGMFSTLSMGDPTFLVFCNVGSSS